MEKEEEEGLMRRGGEEENRYKLITVDKRRGRETGNGGRMKKVVEEGN